MEAYGRNRVQAYMVYRVTENQAISEQDAERLAGQRLRELRTARKWPLHEVASRMKPYGYSWHQTVVAKIETGQRPLRLNEAIALARLFGVDLDDLLFDPTTPGHTEEIEEQIAELEGRLSQASEQHQAAWVNLHRIEADQAAGQVEVEQAASQVAFLQGTLESLRRALKQADEAD